MAAIYFIHFSIRFSQRRKPIHRYLLVSPIAQTEPSFWFVWIAVDTRIWLVGAAADCWGADNRLSWGSQRELKLELES
jgi:hypothetical protein